MLQKHAYITTGQASFKNTRVILRTYRICYLRSYCWYMRKSHQIECIHLYREPTVVCQLARCNTHTIWLPLRHGSRLHKVRHSDESQFGSRPRQQWDCTCYMILLVNLWWKAGRSDKKMSIPDTYDTKDNIYKPHVYQLFIGFVFNIKFIYLDHFNQVYTLYQFYCECEYILNKDNRFGVMWLFQTVNTSVIQTRIYPVVVSSVE